ncbi:FAD-dependent monooxygenase [Kitasatospora sp. NPDC059571]|uniref:FAD-dependent monooxygenase n=1 Tax=Kitasatospora sp. NPDC059571 TaxID=3346871 RepID=UPI00369135FD
MPAAPLHVIVVGAGTGGLCLAHGLRRAGLRVTVYERDRTRTAARPGHRTGLDPRGLRALRACLPPELFRTLLAAGAVPPERFVLLDRRLRPVLAVPLPGGGAGPGSAPELSVSAMTLRQLLLTGLEDAVRFGRTATGHRSHPDGSVSARLDDGTEDRGDLLVGADGAPSCLLPPHPAPPAAAGRGSVLIGAKVPLIAESRALLPPALAPGAGLVRAPRGLSVLLHRMELPWDRYGELKPGLPAEDAALLARWPGLPFDNSRDHIDVGLRTPAGRLPADVALRPGDDLVRLALGLDPRLHPDLRRLLELADPATGFAASAPRPAGPAPWPAGPVALLGDAARPAAPGPGGASAALRDARALVDALTRVRDGLASLDDALLDYRSAAERHSAGAAGPGRPFDAEHLLHGARPARIALAGVRGRLRAAVPGPRTNGRAAAGS